MSILPKLDRDVVVESGPDTVRNERRWTLRDLSLIHI